MLCNIQMILICVATDVLPALNLSFEPPESSLLNHPPRNMRIDFLANFRLLPHVYGSRGILELLCTMSMSVLPLSSPLVPLSWLTIAVFCMQVILVWQQQPPRFPGTGSTL
ncbi:hypothetical protein V8E53_007655 [Lactarius tabidus]